MIAWSFGGQLGLSRFRANSTHIQDQGLHLCAGWREAGT